jgi:hypothetical protein
MRGVRNLIIALVFSPVMPVTAFGNGISCLDQARLRSTATGRPAIVTFVNNSSHAAKIYWIDYAGKRAQHFYVTPGSAISRNSLVTHPWVITDDYDNCIGVAFANPSTPNVEITDSGIVFSRTSGPVLADNPASAISATQAKAAQPLPPEVQSAIDDAIKDCHEKVKFEKGFLTRRDINGDGIDDFILDYGHFACGANISLYCGTAGCSTEVFASLSGGKFAKVLDDNVRGIEFKTIRGRPAMLLELHGSACGKAGSAPCSATLYWNGEKFSPAN